MSLRNFYGTILRKSHTRYDSSKYNPYDVFNGIDVTGLRFRSVQGGTLRWRTEETFSRISRIIRMSLNLTRWRYFYFLDMFLVSSCLRTCTWGNWNGGSMQNCFNVNQNPDLFTSWNLVVMKSLMVIMESLKVRCRVRDNGDVCIFVEKRKLGFVRVYFSVNHRLGVSPACIDERYLQLCAIVNTGFGCNVIV